MHVVITSTPEELAEHRYAAVEVVRELGLRVAPPDPATGGSQAVADRARRVAAADLVLALVGHRRGPTPSPELGGDGFHPWTLWETRAAFDRGLPVRVLMASETWRPELREDDAKARAVMRDFRGELAHLAVFFDTDADDGFRDLVREELLAARRPPSSPGRQVELRRWPPPSRPPTPYPVLLPYTHPDLMGGRERELDELRRRLARPVAILGLHATSGVGKSSLLAGALVPALRAEGRPVAYERHPHEPGLAGRLLGDLSTVAVELDDDAIDHSGTFVEHLRDVRVEASSPPVLVLDQFESLLRGGDEMRHARALVSVLLAASVQRLPGLDGPVCRWILAYRQEFHGRLFQWLRDVSREADDWKDLPHDLSGAGRFQAWALPPLGTPAPGTEDRAEAATRLFLAAIEKPLAIPSGDGGPLYPRPFTPSSAERLARAFGEARVARRSAPLAPELQVVLAHLTRSETEVPEEPSGLVDRALEEHLKRSLDVAFPARKNAAKAAEARIGRTRALLALRELADEGRPAAALARAIGGDGRDVLEKLSTPQTRIVFSEPGDGEQVYLLAHDRLAELIVRLVDDEGAHAGFGVDAELLGLRRFIALQRQLFAAGEEEQATAIPKGHFRRIEEHAGALLWNESGRLWWTACRERRRRHRRRAVRRLGAMAATAALLATLVAVRAVHVAEYRKLFDTIETGEPQASFVVLAQLSAEAEVDSAQLVERLRQREAPFDVLERGLGGVGERERGHAVLRVAELLLPLQREEAPEDPAWIASIVWALDFFAVAPEPALRESAIALRDEVLRPLRRRRPPPPLPTPEDPDWVDVPAGTFQMGSDPDLDQDQASQRERPRHPVTISAFRLMTHEVTNAEYRRLVPDHRKEEAPTLPAAWVDWYEAYTYAAWLGGRLPSEAEWEYAARAGCPYAYCKQDGSEATLSEVGWWTGNTVDPRTAEPARHPVKQLEPNPWGLYDMYGNVSEWSADWVGLYSEESELDPPGPASPTSSGNLRTFRGGNAIFWGEPVRASARTARNPVDRIPHNGLRVVLPSYSDRSSSTTRKP